MTTITQSPDKKNTFGRPALFAALVVLILAAAAIIWQFGPAAANPAAPDTPAHGATPADIWAARSVDSYRFDLQIGCFCLQEMTRPVTVEVREGEVVAITYIDDGTAADLIWFDGFATIDQLHERLAALEAQDPVQFDVTYDETLGIPLSAAVNVSDMIADEELWLEVSSFEALP